MSAMAETELKLNGLSSPRSISSRRESGKRESQKEEKEEYGAPQDQQSTSNTREDDDDGAFIPVVLDKSSLPNSPDPTQSQVFDSPIGRNSQGPVNPQIQNIIANEPVRPSSRQDRAPSRQDR